MKTKILLFAAILLQTTFVFGQGWSNWTTIPNSSISFSAKSSGFDQTKNMYAWNVKFKTSRTPVYFEFKIKGGTYSGSDEIDKYFNTAIFDNRDNENRINGSGGLVYSKSNTLSIAIRNVCFDFGQDRYPKCQKSDEETSSYSSGANGQTSGNNQTQAINQLTNATADLVTYFASRKNALRNSLSQEDGQALMNIVNSDNPVDYTQNIIQIFTDLGYTYRETKTDNDMTFITLGNDVANINDFMLISIQPASYDNYNRISFNYRNKLSQQLSVLGNNLINKGGGKFEIKGISPSRQQQIEQKAIEEKQKKQEEDQKKANAEIYKKEFLAIPTGKVTDENVTVKTIIDNYIKAIGGEEKLQSVKNITEYFDGDFMIGKRITSYGKSSSSIILKEGNHTIKSAFNGTVGYFIYDGGKKNYKDDIEVAWAKKKTQPFQIFVLQQAPDLKLGDIVIFKEKECYTIIETYQYQNLDFVLKHYFDTITGLWIGTENQATSTVKGISGTYFSNTSYSLYDDYREAGGILFPFTNVSFDASSGNIHTTQTINIKINEPVTDTDFE